MKPRKSDGGLWAVDIEGDKYEWERWGAEDALDTLAEILDLLGKPLGGLVAAMQNASRPNGQGATLRDSLTDRVVSGMMRKLKKNKKDVVLILKRLTSGNRVMCNGKPIDFNRHYEDRLPLMFKVANAAVEVQYGNFCDAVLSVLGQDKADLAGTLMNQPPASNQTSGSASAQATGP